MIVPLRYMTACLGAAACLVAEHSFLRNWSFNWNRIQRSSASRSCVFACLLLLVYTRAETMKLMIMLSLCFVAVGVMATSVNTLSLAEKLEHADLQEDRKLASKVLQYLADMLAAVQYNPIEHWRNIKRKIRRHHPIPCHCLTQPCLCRKVNRTYIAWFMQEYTGYE